MTVNLHTVRNAGQARNDTLPGAASSGRRLLRRRMTALVVGLLATISLAGVLGTGVAEAGYGGAGDCARFANTTLVSIPLPANGDYRGFTVQAWLYRSNGSSWVYTGSTAWARGAYGFWINPSGTIASELDFWVNRNSGAYLIYSQSTASNGLHQGGWMTTYSYPGAGSGYYCAA